MKKIIANGAFLVPLALIAYAVISILSVRSLARHSRITEGIDAADLEKLGELNMASVLFVGGAGVLAWVLYMLEPLLSEPTPQWIYFVLPIFVMIAIYFGTPS